jgi:outer membrane receptor protein involved in Fe transport
LIIEGEGTVGFRSLSSWVSADVLYSFDGDWGADPDYDFTSRFLRERRTLTQDFRWSSAPTTEGRPFAWIAGLYGLRVDETNDQLDLFGGEIFRALISDYRADHVAAYGELSFALAPRWSLALGLRAERREAQYQDTDGSDFDPSEDMAGGNLTLAYSEDDRSRWYLALARGYKAGGFNLGAVIPQAQREFGAEWLHSLEVGHKRVSMDGRSSLAAAIFYMRRGDQQVSTSAQLDPGDPLSFIYLTGNAARGANYGVEASWKSRLGTYWQLTGSLGWLKAEFKDYLTVDRDLRGRDQAHAPEWQAVMSLLYQRPSGWFARADSQYQSGYFFSDSHDERAQGRALINLRAGYHSATWQAELWLQNALNEDYAQRGFFFGNEPPDFPDRLYIQLADPRRAGLRLSWTLR